MNLIADAVLSRYVVNFTLICFYERECHGYVIIFHNLQPSTSYECKYSWQSALTRPKIVFGWKTNTIQFNSSSVWSSQSERFCSVFVNVNVSLTKSCVAYQRHPRCFHLETPGAAPQRINWERQKHLFRVLFPLYLLGLFCSLQLLRKSYDWKCPLCSPARV